MKIIKNILLRSVLLVIIIIGFSQVYKVFYHENDLQEYSPLINTIRGISSDCDVLYLAESSNFTAHSNDKDKRRINQMASDYFSDLVFCQIDQGALHAGNYKIILQNLTKHPNLRTVIVTMNLRSFGADWIHSELETALQKQMIFLEKYPPLINRIRLALRAYDIKTKEERRADVLNEWSKNTLRFSHEFPYKSVNEWDRARANGSFLNEDGSWNMELIELSCHFVKNYAFLIDTIKNPRIMDYDAIVKIAKENNWNLVFNILAENVEKAKELAEPELLQLMEQNRDILVSRYTKKGVMVVDNLDDVPDEQYIDRHWPTEHYAEEGRRAIAKNLADSLQKIL
jgi:hypothetical protein